MSEDWAIRGERTLKHEALFCGFSLEQPIPVDHLLRLIDRFFDLPGVRKHLASLLQRDGSALGMLIVGYRMKASTSPTREAEWRPDQATVVPIYLTRN